MNKAPLLQLQKGCNELNSIIFLKSTNKLWPKKNQLWVDVSSLAAPY
jgi:hypothetical protein